MYDYDLDDEIFPFNYLEYLTDSEQDISLLETVYNTYDDWKALGLPVKKGMVSGKRNSDGVSLFSGKQVRLPKLIRSNKEQFVELEHLKTELNNIKNSYIYKFFHLLKLL